MLSGGGRLSSQAQSLVPQVRTNALRFGPDNVTVNTVIPGIVESEAWDKCGTEVYTIAKEIGLNYKARCITLSHMCCFAFARGRCL